MRKAVVAHAHHAVLGHVVSGGVCALVFLRRVGQEDVRVLEACAALAQPEGKSRDSVLLEILMSKA